MVSLTRVRGDGAGSDRHEESRWLIVMAATTLAEFAWWAATWTAGLAPYPSLATYLVLAFVGLAAAIVLRLVFRKHATRSSSRSVLAGTALVAIGGSLFLPLKFAIPGQVPFWLDAHLANFERTFFGEDPWLLLDHVLGWAAVPMDWLYLLWMPVQLLVLFTVMLEPASPAKSRSLVCYTLVWFLLGVAAATLFSSVGPIFFDRLNGGESFAQVRETLEARGARLVLAESDAMWSAYASGTRGLLTGISAVPSIHVAISLWIVLTARVLAPKLAKWAIAYFMLIWIGSVQLGWHYVSDGLAGVIGTLFIWRLATAVHGAFDRFRRRSLAPEAERCSVTV